MNIDRASPDEKLARKRAQRLASYHRNKHKRQRPPGVVPLAEFRATVAAKAAERAAAKAASRKPRRDRPMTPAERREYNRAWRAAHPTYKKSWKKANPDKVRADRRGRHSKSNARRRKALMKVQRGRCGYCRCKLEAGKTHIDHIMPKALGGPNRRSNLQLLC